MANKEQFIIEILDKFSKQLDEATEGVREIREEVGELNETTKSATSGFKTLIATVGGFTAVKEIVKTTAQIQALETSIKFASGSAEAGQKSLDFVRKTADELGLSLLPAIEGFRTLQGSLIGTKFDADDARTVFRQVSEAVTAMNLSGEDARGVFLALGQVISKGKVQAEELRGQIGERIPGAFNIAARAIGVTNAQLDKMLEQGQLTADQFLLPFAAELHRTFGQAVPEASQTLQANLNRMDTAFLELKESIGNEFLPEITRSIKFIGDFVNMISKNRKFIRQFIKIIGVLVVSFVSYKVAVRAATFVTRLWTTLTAVARAASTGFAFSVKGVTQAVQGMSLAIKANPIGLIASLLSTAAAAFLAFKDDVDSATGSVEEFNKELEEIQRLRQRAVFGKLVFGDVLSEARKNQQQATPVAQDLQQRLQKLDVSQLEALQEFLETGTQSLTRDLKNNVQAQNLFLKDFTQILALRTTRKTAPLTPPEVLALGKNTLELIRQELAKLTPGRPTFGAGDDSIKAGISGVRASAPKVFNITIEKLVEEQNINTTSTTEGSPEIEQNIVEAFLNAINDVEVISR